MSGGRDKYHRPAKEQRAVDVMRLRAQSLTQRETAAYLISKAYHDAPAADPGGFARTIVELAEAERVGRSPDAGGGGLVTIRHEVRGPPPQLNAAGEYVPPQSP